MTPTEIARKLTKAQREAVQPNDWGAWVRRGSLRVVLLWRGAELMKEEG